MKVPFHREQITSYQPRQEPHEACQAPVDPVAAFLAGRNLRTLRAYFADVADFALLGSPHGSANALAPAYRADLSARDLTPATS